MNSFLKALSLIFIHWMRISGHSTFLLILVFIHAVALSATNLLERKPNEFTFGFAFLRVQLWVFRWNPCVDSYCGVYSQLVQEVSQYCTFSKSKRANSHCLEARYRQLVFNRSVIKGT